MHLKCLQIQHFSKGHARCGCLYSRGLSDRLCSDTRAEWDGRYLPCLCRGTQNIPYTLSRPSTTTSHSLPQGQCTPRVPIRVGYGWHMYRTRTYRCPRRALSDLDLSADRRGNLDSTGMSRTLTEVSSLRPHIPEVRSSS